MKFLEVYDDVQWHEAGEKVLATEQRAFTVQGVNYSLDLTVDNAKRFDEAIAPWIDLAEAIKAPELAKSIKTPKQNNQHRSWKVNPARVQWFANLRKWADETGHSYHTSTGQIYYPRHLRSQYETASGTTEPPILKG